MLIGSKFRRGRGARGGPRGRTTSLTLAGSLHSQAHALAEFDRQGWVVRKVFPTEWSSGGDVLQWSNVESLADPTGDGRTEFSIEGSWEPTGSAQARPYWVVEGGPLRRHLGFSPGPAFLTQNTVFLKAWQGYRAVVRGTGLTKLQVYDTSSLTLLFEIPRPTAPPGYPRMVGFGARRPAGDVNSDGCSDLLYQAYADAWSGSYLEYGIIGAIDGSDGTSLWQTYLLDEPLVDLATDYFCERPGALHNDKEEEFFFAATLDRQDLYAFRSLSRSSGAVAWEYEEQNAGVLPIDRYFAPVPDLNDDGKQDLVVMRPHSPYFQHPGHIYALSGTDGSLLWENRTIGYLDPYFTNTQFPRNQIFWNVAPLGDLDRDGAAEVAIVVHESEYLRPDHYLLHVFDGRTGTFLEHQGLPEYLAPFLPQETTHESSWRIYPLGDVDGDGYLELAIVAPSPFYVHATGAKGQHLAILGRRTLRAPASVGLGQGVGFEIDVPAGGDCPFHLLVSDRMVWDGSGYAVSGWDTFLGPGTLLARSLSHPAFSGRLDANGFGGVHAVVPSNPALAGRTFWARAWIEEATTPGAILTMTSLESLLVLP